VENLKQWGELKVGRKGPKKLGHREKIELSSERKKVAVHPDEGERTSVTIELSEHKFRFQNALIFVSDGQRSAFKKLR
jgi:hypothetical protein